MATVKKMVKKAAPKKAQTGVAEYKTQWGKKTADSSAYFRDRITDNAKAVQNLKNSGYPKEYYSGYEKQIDKDVEDRKRQRRKGQPGFDANGFPLKKSKMGSKVKKAFLGFSSDRDNMGGGRNKTKIKIKIKGKNNPMNNSSNPFGLGDITRTALYNPEEKMKRGGSMKKKMKTGGTLTPSKKSVGKTLGKLNKAKYGSKTSKKK